VSVDRIADQHQPLVRAKTLPGDERGAAAGAERASDVGERPHGVVEEHQSELADEEIERAGDEVVSLCIGDHELRVGDRRSLRSAPCQLHERLRQVDADDAFGTGSDGKCRRARPAADVEHDPVRVRPGPFEEGLGEGFELAVVSVGVVDEVRGFGSVPRLRLSFVCSHWLLADVHAVPHHVTADDMPGPDQQSTGAIAGSGCVAARNASLRSHCVDGCHGRGVTDTS
jgi:hypothetical protein